LPSPASRERVSRPGAAANSLPRSGGDFRATGMGARSSLAADGDEAPTGSP
jgi:hypothetical protein